LKEIIAELDIRSSSYPLPCVGFLLLRYLQEQRIPTILSRPPRFSLSPASAVYVGSCDNLNMVSEPYNFQVDLNHIIPFRHYRVHDPCLTRRVFWDGSSYGQRPSWARGHFNVPIRPFLCSVVNLARPKRWGLMGVSMSSILRSESQTFAVVPFQADPKSLSTMSLTEIMVLNHSFVSPSKKVLRRNSFLLTSSQDFFLFFLLILTHWTHPTSFSSRAASTGCGGSDAHATKYCARCELRCPQASQSEEPNHRAADPFSNPPLWRSGGSGCSRGGSGHCGEEGFGVYRGFRSGSREASECKGSGCGGCGGFNSSAENSGGSSSGCEVGSCGGGCCGIPPSSA
jgi:hypothetical protein